MIRIRKILAISAVISILISCSACRSGEIEALKQENAELKQKLEAVNQEGNPIAEGNPTAQPTAAAQTTATFALNQPITIDTEYGSYIVTITDATIKDWRERSGGSIDNLNVMLTYTVQNVNFTNSTNPGCYVGSDLFYVYDNNKNLLQTATYSYDTKFPDVVLPGYSAEFNVCYDLVSESTEYIDVILHRYDINGRNKILGQMRLGL